jgi:hypothetical protein
MTLNGNDCGEWRLQCYRNARNVFVLGVSRVLHLPEVRGLSDLDLQREAIPDESRGPVPDCKCRVVGIILSGIPPPVR